MKAPGINADEILKLMATEAGKQHEQIRTAVRDLTLEALQMRELSLKQINGVVRNISAGVNAGVGDSKLDTGKALSDALAGMDDALLKVVEATGDLSGLIARPRRRAMGREIARRSDQKNRGSFTVAPRLLWCNAGIILRIVATGRPRTDEFWIRAVTAHWFRGDDVVRLQWPSIG
jgi:hypothetical protein